MEYWMMYHHHIQLNDTQSDYKSENPDSSAK